MRELEAALRQTLQLQSLNPVVVECAKMPVFRNVNEIPNVLIFIPCGDESERSQWLSSLPIAKVVEQSPNLGDADVLHFINHNVVDASFLLKPCRMVRVAQL